MCQFNLVFVKNVKNKKILKNNGYHRFGDELNNFSPYSKGLCDCNSFVGSMCEYDGHSYFEMIESSNKSELEKLRLIKDLMSESDYKELKENYMKARTSLSDILEKLLEPISNYEMEQMEILEKKYKGKELQKHTERLYTELENKINKIENSSEFKLAQTKLNEFIEKNNLMEESTFYYLTKEDEYSEYEHVSSDEIFSPNETVKDLDISPEYVDITEEDSLVIDDVIKKLENKYNNDYSIFLEYKQLFKKLLENEDYILFSCIWDEPGEMSIEKEVNINDITIEDLASLEFIQMLKIYK